MPLLATIQGISTALVAIPTQVTAAINALTTLETFLKANV